MQSKLPRKNVFHDMNGVGQVLRILKTTEYICNQSEGSSVVQTVQSTCPELTDMSESKSDLSSGIERRTGIKHTASYKDDRRW